MRIVWVRIHSDQNSINEGGSNTAATPLVKKICIETAANDPCPNNTCTRSISSCFLMQQTAGSQNRESLLQQAARIPNPNCVGVEMELDQTTNPNSMDVEMEVEETSDPNSVDCCIKKELEMDIVPVVLGPASLVAISMHILFTSSAAAMLEPPSLILFPQRPLIAANLDPLSPSLLQLSSLT